MRTLARRWTINGRLQVATVTAVFSLLLLLGWVQMMEAQRLQSSRITLLQSIVQAAIGIAGHYQQEAAAGHLTTEAAQQLAADAVKAMRYQGAEYLWIQDMAPRMVMHAVRPDLDGKFVGDVADPTGLRPFTALVDIVKAHGEGELADMWPRPGSDQPVPKLLYAKGFAPWGWIIGTGVYVDDLIAARQRLAVTLGLVGLIAAAFMGGTIWLIGRSVSRPIQALGSAAKSLAADDLAISVPSLDRRDEIGAMANALDVLRNASLERRKLEQDIAVEQKAKDVRQAVLERHTKEFGNVVGGVVEQLALSAGAMRQTSADLVDAVSRTEARAIATAEGARESSMNLSTVVSAAEQLAASVNEISQQIARATDAARDATQRVSQTDEKVGRLAKSADQIGAVVGLITDIAGQTNLLALNATIEAARAGDAGKGFAVVAGEVKTLAAQTARATDDIRAQVEAIRAATAEAVATVSGVHEAVGQMEQVVNAIAAAVEEQSAATREITCSAQAVSGSSQMAVQAMEAVCGDAGNAGAASRTVSSEAEGFITVSEKLRMEMDQFLKSIATR